MSSILFVDDDPAVLNATRRMLHGNQEGWNASYSQGAKEALHMLRTTHVDAVVTDVAMPGMSGLDLLRHICEGGYGFLPVIVVTGVQDRDMKRQALALGAQDLLSKPVDHEDLVARLRSILALKSLHDELAFRNAQLEDIVAARTAELASSRLELVFQLAKAAELRDAETGNHIIRVALFSRALALSLGHTVPEGDELFLASTLHDVGKICVPDAVLHKNKSLEPDERKIIEKHCMAGFKILSERGSAMADLLPPGINIAEETPRLLLRAAEIARSHHEWWDGTGYPDGLKGEKIPLSARIVAVADVLDALRSVRPYKTALTWEEAFAQVQQGSGTHFDPSVCEALASVESEMRDLDEQMRANEPSEALKEAA